MVIGPCRFADGAGAGVGSSGGVFRVVKPVSIVAGKIFPLESRSGSFFLGARFVDRRKKNQVQASKAEANGLENAVD